MPPPVSGRSYVGIFPFQTFQIAFDVAVGPKFSFRIHLAVLGDPRNFDPAPILVRMLLLESTLSPIPQSMEDGVEDAEDDERREDDEQTHEFQEADFRYGHLGEHMAASRVVNSASIEMAVLPVALVIDPR
jgi:hypothetical protein